MKLIEEINDEDLQEIWPVIGGEPHLFEYGKDELRRVLVTGECMDEDNEPTGLQLDYYTMAAMVAVLRKRGFQTPYADEISNLLSSLPQSKEESSQKDAMKSCR